MLHLLIHKHIHILMYEHKYWENFCWRIKKWGWAKSQAKLHLIKSLKTNKIKWNETKRNEMKRRFIADNICRTYKILDYLLVPWMFVCLFVCYFTIEEKVRIFHSYMKKYIKEFNKMINVCLLYKKGRKIILKHSYWWPYYRILCFAHILCGRIYENIEKRQNKYCNEKNV